MRTKALQLLRGAFLFPPNVAQPGGSFFVILGIISFFRVYFLSISVIILVLRVIPAPLWIFTNSLRWANVPSSALVVFGIANSGYFW
jgi:hypothetical protein